MWHRAKPIEPSCRWLLSVVCLGSGYNFFLRTVLRIPSLRSAAILSFEDQSTSISSRCTVDKTVAEDQEVHPDMPDPTTAVHDLAADHPGKDDVNLSPHPGLRPTKPSLKTSGRFLHTGSLPQTCWITTQCMACHSLVELSVPALPGHWE